MLQIVGGEGERRANVVLGELRIGLHNIGERAARAELAQDRLDRDARALDTGLGSENGRVRRYAGMGQGPPPGASR